MSSSSNHKEGIAADWLRLIPVRQEPHLKFGKFWLDACRFAFAEPRQFTEDRNVRLVGATAQLCGFRDFAGDNGLVCRRDRVESPANHSAYPL